MVKSNVSFNSFIEQTITNCKVLNGNNTFFRKWPANYKTLIKHSMSGKLLDLVAVQKTCEVYTFGTITVKN